MDIGKNYQVPAGVPPFLPFESRDRVSREPHYAEKGDRAEIAPKEELFLQAPETLLTRQSVIKPQNEEKMNILKSTEALKALRKN